MSQILKIIDRRRNSTEGRLHLTEKTFVLVTARNEKHPWDVMLASIVSLHEWTFFLLQGPRRFSLSLYNRGMYAKNESV